ncbi:hypothetical protein AB0F17_59665 [Nonomuraea sp. NPDC026600]|uniref:hypothetical protein n=1 Tax=Nonomuraea sp. NPDC026600 TaxID=3155363 RepID=UPI0033FE2410
MRAKEIPAVLEAAVREHFPEDVAQAITGDADALGAAVYHASYAADTPDDLEALIKAIAAEVDDHLADWLVSAAAAPAAWLASQIRDH